MTMHDPECGDCGGTGWLQETVVDRDTGTISSQEALCRRAPVPAQRHIPRRETAEACLPRY
ncbi:hypothetical protein SAMN05216266_11071 [Amycolatopsis marina]|uniref:Uncharacterized protein n=1 Tax=Amycolatopsis marina TaxID=490629 RepID=A0A1I1AVM9_9PSEU|nr:hypothetical protein SAMN05216266_11071 [Amycolatopsis marina]